MRIKRSINRDQKTIKKIKQRVTNEDTRKQC